MVILRGLKEKDATGMYEWMQDAEIQSNFVKQFKSYSFQDAKDFCTLPNGGILANGQSVHYAIADDVTDEYLGTISLKNIDLTNKNAEYAIVTRRCVWGNGVAQKATELVLTEAFAKYHLHKVYLTVFADNVRAIRLYQKCGFILEGTFRDHVLRTQQYVDWDMFGILSEEYFSRMRSAK